MRIKIMATAALIGVSLSGCLGGGTEGLTNRGLESVHQPVVTQDHYVLDVPAPNGELGPDASRRVSEWMDAIGVRYGDRVSIDDTATNGARPARDVVHALLIRKGLMLSDNAPITPGVIAPGNVRVVISRAHASVPGCPDWGTRSATDFNTRTTSNYGCATNANVAAMVADPLDLVRGQNDRTNDPLTASRAINTYRTAPPTGAGGLQGTGTGGSGGPAAPGGGGR
jgi:pilus assembly protein CpaD